MVTDTATEAKAFKATFAGLYVSCYSPSRAVFAEEAGYSLARKALAATEPPPLVGDETGEQLRDKALLLVQWNEDLDWLAKKLEQRINEED